MKKLLITAAVIAAVSLPARAQTIGGNVSIAATTSSANIALPADPNAYPYLLLEYGGATTNELFYKLGSDNTVLAVAPSLPTTQGSPAVPANGVCIRLSSTQTWLAAIAGASTATLRATQLNVCPTK